MGNCCGPRKSSAEEAEKIVAERLAREGVGLIDIKLPGNEAFVSTSNHELTVLSYNLLADYYNTTIGKDVSSHMTFEYRSRIIKEEIKKFNADIIFLQEVDTLKESYGSYLSSLGYEVLYKMNKGTSEGPALGFKKDLFHLCNSKIIDFDTGHRYEKNSDFATGHLAIFAELKYKHINQIIKLINVHFFHDPKYDYVKYLQMFLVLRYMEQNFKEDDIIIWGGDLNSLPSENIIPYVRDRSEPLITRISMNREVAIKFEKEVYQEMQQTFKKNFKWGNVYEHYGTSLGIDLTFPEWTNYTKGFKGTLDHIFYNKKQLLPKKLLKIPRETIIQTEKLPNARHPSDHVPLLSVFEII